MFMPKNRKRRHPSVSINRLGNLAVLGLSALLVATCGLRADSNQSPRHDGTVAIPMTALDRDGRVYRIAQAKVWMAGPVHGQLKLDRRASQVFHQSLPAGRYTFGLSGPVTLWRHDDAGGATTFTAEAVISRPLVYTVRPGELTQVVLEFHTENGRIRFNDSNLGALSEVDVVSCREGSIERSHCEIPFGSTRARTCMDGQWTPWRACLLDKDVFYAVRDEQK
jgi:hypothetical protein